METMLLQPGEKVHVILRRAFEDDLRRHFAGVVVACDDGAARLEGFTFVHDPNLGTFERRLHKRIRIVSLVDAGNLINVLPANIDVEQLEYRNTRDGRLAVTDGSDFSLDVQEFSRNR